MAMGDAARNVGGRGGLPGVPSRRTLTRSAVLVVFVVALVVAFFLVPKPKIEGPVTIVFSGDLGALLGGLFGLALVLGASLYIAYGFETSQSEDPSEGDLAKSIRTALVPVWLGLLALAVFSTASVHEAESAAVAFTQTLGSGLAIAGAGLLMGALLGFLFGVPRAPVPVAGAAGTADAAHPSYTDNTNIEEISDWLTKIIVGLGLVELRSVPEYLSKLGRRIAESPFQQGELGVGFLVLFGIGGFFLGHLATRLFLPGALSRQRRVANVIDDLKDGERTMAGYVDEKKLPSVGGPELDDLRKAEAGTALPSSFVRGSEDHERYRALRKRGLLRPKEGGQWQPGKHLELTPIGAAVLRKQNRDTNGEA
jgi:hypothetical protein